MNLEQFFDPFLISGLLWVQLAAILLLFRVTDDRRTWSLLVVGTMTSIIARILPFFIAIPVWLDDVSRFLAIAFNTGGFVSLYLLLKKLVKEKAQPSVLSRKQQI